MGLEFGGVPKMMENVVDILMDPNYTILKSFKDLNYGHISIEQEQLEISIRDINGIP